MGKKGASAVSANGPIDRIVRTLGHRETIGSNLKNLGLCLLPMDNLIKAKMENKEVRAASANGMIDRVTTHLGLRATIGSNLPHHGLRPPPSADWQQPQGNAWRPPNGKGKPSNKTKLWCDIHQAYGHSADWCFSNPNRTGGPLTPEWCDHHQSFEHSTAACRKGNGPPSSPQPPPGPTPSAAGG